MAGPYALGLDYGTQSVRALVVDVRTGEELGAGVFAYPSGTGGVLLDPARPNLARQHPQDYLDGLEASVRAALDAALAQSGAFDPARVIGVGVDTTGSTPLPVDEDGRPLAFDEGFREELAAHVWLWKDHTGHAEAEEITALAEEMRPAYLAKCGGTYSSEWFWSKILHCAREAPAVFEAAYTWVEHADWMPAVLTGTEHPDAIKRSICAAGHKAMFSGDWGGYPDEDFLGALGGERLVRVRRTLPDEAYNAATPAGALTEDWAERLGLPAGLPVAVGAFDAHLGAVGAGIEPGTLVKIMGTSTCDLMVTPLARDLPDIPGLCGIVPESVLPGQYGLEAGQSAVGDIFNWFVRLTGEEQSHEALTAEAERLAPGESGLLALDWHNGNRTVLVDQRLSGGLLGLTLSTTPAGVYRALIEATAFGARVIMERYEEYGVAARRITSCGGIAAKNELVMQIYADVMGRPVQISRSDQTPALGAAMSGAVVAGAEAGGYADFDAAADAMTGVQERVFEPIPEHRETYDQLYRLYRRLHDAFGVQGAPDDLYDVMKTLLDLRDEVKRGHET